MCTRKQAFIRNIGRHSLPTGRHLLRRPTTVLSAIVAICRPPFIFWFRTTGPVVEHRPIFYMSAIVYVSVEQSRMQNAEKTFLFRPRRPFHSF